mgnify:CR=1 FL=1
MRWSATSGLLIAAGYLAGPLGATGAVSTVLFIVAALVGARFFAAEAIEARQREAGTDYRGRIAVSLGVDEHALAVTVADNGIGLPKDRERIVEPYVTTREKGTGLGLAIVNKIVEEHGGDMIFAPRPEGGTSVTLRFARAPQRSPASAGHVS